jgi:GT2 family glycosyltransferase
VNASAGSDRPRLSVVIVNYNVRDLLENCLHSVEKAMAGMEGEVFVVDNNSDDGSADMVRERFPAVRLIASTRNEGFARANNLALAEAQGEYLLLLNPDTLVQEDTFSVMLGFFDDNRDVGMAGCRIITPDGSLEPACRRSFPSPWVSFTKLTGLSTVFPRSSLFARYNLTYLSEDETYEVDAISGSFMMLRREVYERIGGLDEDYFMYGEDLDWCYRVQRAGWKICYVHTTKIIHYGGESTKRSSIDATAVFYRAMELFARKNLRLSRLSYAVITLGIKLRLGVTRARSLAARAGAFLVDAVLTLVSLTLGELIRLGEVPGLPAYAYPTVQITTVLVVVVALALTGTYTRREYRVLRAALGVVLSLLLLSTMTFFFKEYAFSRAVVLIASACNIVLLPGWRLVRAALSPGGESLVTGRPTLLVGLTEQALVVLERLRTYDAGTYRVVGLIDVTRRRFGERIGGVEVLGSVDNIGKVIAEHGVTEVIVAPDVLTYAEILSMISRARDVRVSYRIVPRSMVFIVG